MNAMVRRIALLLAPLVGALVACGGPADQAAFPPGDREADYAAVDVAGTDAPFADAEAAEPPAPVSSPGSVVAEGIVPTVRIFRHLGDDRPWTSLRGPGLFDAPRVFLVREQRDDWLRVLLPMEPNGSRGWIRARDVRLSENPFRVRIDLQARRLTALDGDRMVMREPVAVGTDATPTPTGLFFTTVLARPDDPSGPYGPFAYGLSAYSEVLDTFAGGDGQVAIHGTNAPSLIGTAASHGCIRVRNDVIRQLARLLPLGTPVRVSD
jgi:lipoprotein-anchoring transpeptidase ErfK/SrfK